MARQKSDVVSDMVDDVPAKTAAAPPATPDPRYPFGWLVKHPGYGALRVTNDEAKTLDEAVEVYRQKKCPHVKRELLDETGTRATALAFRPAATEVGK